MRRHIFFDTWDVIYLTIHAPVFSPSALAPVNPPPETNSYRRLGLQMGPAVPNSSNPPVTTASAQESAENIRGPQPRYGGSSSAQTLVRTGGDTDGLLERFVPGGYRGVQLMAYS